MTSLRVLVVDDEYPIRRFLRVSLESSYHVLEAENGGQALEMVAFQRPDLVILDLGLPDMDGLEVTRRLREWTLIPIVVVSVRDQETTKVAALDAGADDYLTKPFSAAELLARLRAALRHCARPDTVPVYESGDLLIDLSRRVVVVDSRQVGLTPTEYDILRALVTHAGKVLTHTQLIRAVWGGSADADSHLLRVNISNLRKKIETNPLRPRHIITEPGVGYRLKEIEATP